MEYPINYNKLEKITYRKFRFSA